MVFVFEPVRGRSRATELPCFMLLCRSFDILQCNNFDLKAFKHDALNMRGSTLFALMLSKFPLVYQYEYNLIVSPVRSTYGGYYGLVVVPPRPRPRPRPRPQTLHRSHDNLKNPYRIASIFYM